MGNSFDGCCNDHHYKLDDFFSVAIQTLEIKKLTFKEVEDLFFTKDKTPNLSKFSVVTQRNLQALENSFLKISKENFLKIAETHFYKNSKENHFRDAHELLFKNLFDCLYLIKTDVLLYLLTFVKDSEIDKLKNFCELIVAEGNTTNYVTFKNKLKVYIEFNLIVIPQAFSKVNKSFEEEKDVQNEKRMDFLDEVNRDELEYQLKEIFVYDNIMNFLDYVLKEYEEKHFKNFEDYYNQKKILLNRQDIYDILIMQKFLFNFTDLRKYFKLKYTI